MKIHNSNNNLLRLLRTANHLAWGHHGFHTQQQWPAPAERLAGGNFRFKCQFGEHGYLEPEYGMGFSDTALVFAFDQQFRPFLPFGGYLRLEK